MPRMMALRPLNRMARRLLLPQGLMRARPAVMRRTRLRPRSIAIPASKHSCWRWRRPSYFAQACTPATGVWAAPSEVHYSPTSSTSATATTTAAKLAQSSLHRGLSGSNTVSESVEGDVESPGVFLTMVEILKAFRETLEREGVSADMFDTVRQVDEVLQEYPALIIAFREFFT